jgi:hypothetical protein
MTAALFMYSPQPPQAARVLSLRWAVECGKCYGAGWYPETPPGFDDDDDHGNYDERYCDCEAGKWRRIHDGTEPVWC